MHMLSTNGGKAWAERVKALLDSSPFGKNCHVYAGKDLWHMRSLLFTEPVDFLIGNTYGKYLERDTGTPLIRIGFPIFDRHHHHRYPVWGYQGGMNVLVWILDKIFDEIDRNTNVPAKNDFSFDIIRCDGASGVAMSLCPNKMQEVFDEPACGKNQGKPDKERKKGCTKQLCPRGGRGRLRLRRRQDRAAADHRRGASGARSDRLRRPFLGQPAFAVLGPATYRTGFTTDISELDIVYGGEKRLYKAMKEIIEKYDPPAVFVYQTCVTALIGDDIEVGLQGRQRKSSANP